MIKTTARSRLSISVADAVANESIKEISAVPPHSIANPDIIAVRRYSPARANAVGPPPTAPISTNMPVVDPAIVAAAHHQISAHVPAHHIPVDDVSRGRVSIDSSAAMEIASTDVTIEGSAMHAMNSATTKASAAPRVRIRNKSREAEKNRKKNYQAQSQSAAHETHSQIWLGWFGFSNYQREDHNLACKRGHAFFRLPDGVLSNRAEVVDAVESDARRARWAWAIVAPFLTILLGSNVQPTKNEIKSL